MVSMIQATPLRRLNDFIAFRASRTLDNLVVFLGLPAANALHSLGSYSGPRCSQSLDSKVPRAIFEAFTDKASEVIVPAEDESTRLGHHFVGAELILLGLGGEGTSTASKVLKSGGVKLSDGGTAAKDLKSGAIKSRDGKKIIEKGAGFATVEKLEISSSRRRKRVSKLLLEKARQLGCHHIGSEHLLLGLLRESEGMAACVHDNIGVDSENILIGIIEDGGGGGGGGLGSGNSRKNNAPTLDEYGTNLTKLAKEGRLDPVIGRQEQIQRVIQILGCRTKNNPCLIGRPGVGKTAIVEGLAQRIVDGDVTEKLQGKTVIMLDIGLLVARRKYLGGEFDEQLRKLMEEIKRNYGHNVILFINEVNALIGARVAQAAVDASNILKPALAHGEIQYIGATTLDEYKNHIENNPGLERHFLPVKIPEPTIDETVEILKGVRERYEIHHKLRYTDESLVAAAKLSHIYIEDRFLPEKAIDLIDEAGSRVAQLPEEQRRQLEKKLRQIGVDKDEAVASREFEKAGELLNREIDLKAEIVSAVVENKKEMRKAAGDGGGVVVTELDILHIMSAWTGIRIERLSTSESDGLLEALGLAACYLAFIIFAFSYISKHS